MCDNGQKQNKHHKYVTSVFFIFLPFSPSHSPCFLFIYRFFFWLVMLLFYTQHSNLYICIQFLAVQIHILGTVSFLLDVCYRVDRKKATLILDRSGQCTHILITKIPTLCWAEILILHNMSYPIYVNLFCILTLLLSNFILISPPSPYPSLPPYSSVNHPLQIYMTLSKFKSAGKYFVWNVMRIKVKIDRKQRILLR